MNEIKDFWNLHECLEDARGVIEPKQALISASFRLKDETKDMVDKVCAQHNTTLSTFLRRVCERLALEYVSADALEPITTP